MRITIIKQLRRHAERASALVLAGLWPGRSFEDVVGMLEHSAPATWRFYVFGTLGLLFLLALISAAFGVVGLAIYFGAVVLLVR